MKPAVQITLIIGCVFVAIVLCGVLSQWIKSRPVRPPNRCPDCQKRAVSEATAQARAGIAKWKQTIRTHPANEGGGATADDVRSYPQKPDDDAK